MILVVMAVATTSIYAKEARTKLLAVVETPTGYEGSMADLSLKITAGTGNVYMDTSQLTKFDTQISTRFAKEIACDFLDVDCSQYDFTYTIKASSSIIGGPSAGAATAVLTASLLDGFIMDESIGITGTIDSGGLIGSVGGLKAKLEAAAGAGLKKVLIPNGERYIEENNQTIDLVDYGKTLGIDVIEVSDLNDAIYEFTGERFQLNDKELVINPFYENTMESLAVQLCNRSMELDTQLVRINKTLDYNRLEKALNLTQESTVVFESGKYYTAASLCFGANVIYGQIIMTDFNLSSDKIEEIIKDKDAEIERFNTKINNRDYKTITDLEAFMVVKERLIESEESLKTATNLNDVAYAIERLYSAYSWANFFDQPGREFNLDSENLKESCLTKLSEAEERYQYVGLFLPNVLDRKELDYAYQDLNNENYELCLFKASKAKAEANTILSVMDTKENQTVNIINKKLLVAKNIIIKENENDAFPILGYSYYEYADYLKEKDPYSALLYTEYALELSSLDLYFKEKNETFKPITDLYSNFYMIFILLIGVILGLLIAYPFIRRKSYTIRIK